MMALLMFPVLFVLLFTGFPVAFALAGCGLLFTVVGVVGGELDVGQVMGLLSKRIFENTVDQQILIAVPLFVWMGMILDRSGLAEDLLRSMQRLTGRLRGGLAIAVIMVGGLLAAATGIVGATVVTLTVLALPTMLERGYDRSLACGTIAASGTLGQIIPPSIVLILLGDQMGVSVGQLFQGAMVPGLLLVVAYAAYVLIRCRLNPGLAGDPIDDEAATEGVWRDVARSLLPALSLILVVLGSILAGLATPTEASGCGAVGALGLAAAKGRLNREGLRSSLEQTVQITAMVLMILVGAQLFSLVFQKYNGGEQIAAVFTHLGFGQVGFIVSLMVLVFVLGFFLDFLEICFIVVPALNAVMDIYGFGDLQKIFIGVLLALNLQTSFVTPPFGFSLFYLKGAAPASVRTGDLYRGIVPFVLIQLALIVLVWFVPDLILALPLWLKV